ncbi:hypothetical protein H9P43_006558 [Blastocladiella emersonii ATCC 22665]|nr:hypothetical protein H9P43_006558 [Blastocladiella emersonii ATCC 22665]
MYAEGNPNRHSTLLLVKMKFGEKMGQILNVCGDWLADESAAVLDSKLDWYIRACCTMAEPCAFRIPAHHRVRQAPEQILGVFEVTSDDLHSLRVAPAVLDGDDEDVVADLVKAQQKGVSGKRKRTRQDTSDEPKDGAEADSVTRRLRPRHAARAGPAPRPQQLDAGPSRSVRRTPTSGAEGPGTHAQQTKATEVVDLTTSDDEDVKPEVEKLPGLDPETEFSADVFEELGEDRKRVPPGELGKRIKTAFRRGWDKARTAEWIRML